MSTLKESDVGYLGHNCSAYTTLSADTSADTAVIHVFSTFLSPLRVYKPQR